MKKYALRRLPCIMNKTNSLFNSTATHQSFKILMSIIPQPHSPMDRVECEAICHRCHGRPGALGPPRYPPPRHLGPHRSCCAPCCCCRSPWSLSRRGRPSRGLRPPWRARGATRPKQRRHLEGKVNAMMRGVRGDRSSPNNSLIAPRSPSRDISPRSLGEGLLGCGCSPQSTVR